MDGIDGQEKDGCCRVIAEPPDFDHSGLYDLLISQRLATFLLEGTEQALSKRTTTLTIGKGRCSFA